MSEKQSSRESEQCVSLPTAMTEEHFVLRTPPDVGECFREYLRVPTNNVRKFEPRQFAVSFDHTSGNRPVHHGMYCTFSERASPPLKTESFLGEISLGDASCSLTLVKLPAKAEGWKPLGDSRVVKGLDTALALVATEKVGSERSERDGRTSANIWQGSTFGHHKRAERVVCKASVF